MPKGTKVRPVRVPDDIWDAAVAAFPSERGKPGGVSAKIQSFVSFLAEHPDAWTAIEAVAEDRGIGPWELIAGTLGGHVS